VPALGDTRRGDTRTDRKAELPTLGEKARQGIEEGLQNVSAGCSCIFFLENELTEWGSYPLGGTLVAIGRGRGKETPRGVGEGYFPEIADEEGDFLMMERGALVAWS